MYLKKSHWERKVRTSLFPQGRENASSLVAFGFGLSFDRLRGGHEFYRPIKERGEAKPMPSQISFILFCSAENFSEI